MFGSSEYMKYFPGNYILQLWTILVFHLHKILCHILGLNNFICTFLMALWFKNINGWYEFLRFSWSWLCQLDVFLIFFGVISDLDVISLNAKAVKNFFFLPYLKEFWRGAQKCSPLSLFLISKNTFSVLLSADQKT